MNKILIATFVVLIIACVACQQAKAEFTVLDSGSWVYSNQANKHGNLVAFTHATNYTNITLGVVTWEDGWYIFIKNNDYEMFDRGGKYTVKILFDNDPIKEYGLIGNKDETQASFSSNDQYSILEKIMSKNTMVVRTVKESNDVVYYEFNLNGSTKAIKYIIESAAKLPSKKDKYADKFDDINKNVPKYTF